MDKLKLSTANLVILIAGGVILIASFLDFYASKKIGDGPFAITIGGGNAWSSGRFLIATIPALLGVLMAAEVALVTFAPQVSLPDHVLGFTRTQVLVVLGAQATIMMLAFLLQNTGGIGKGIGMYLMLIAAIALLVGAVMRLRENPGPTGLG